MSSSPIILSSSPIILPVSTDIPNTDNIPDSDGKLKIFTKNEKMKLCSSMGSKQRDMLITFGNVHKYNLPPIKEKEWVAKIIERVKTPSSVITYMTIAYEEADEGCKFPHYHVVIKIDSKNTVRCGAIKKKLYELFPDYHGNIDFSVKNANCYLDKAKYLVCPTKDKIIDPTPMVYGETHVELMKRIENSAGGAKRKREIEENWTTELVNAAREAEGDYAVFMESEAFKTLGWDKPYQCITAFRELSKARTTELTEEIFPLSDYRYDMITFMDEWYKGKKLKGDVLIFQGIPDMCKTRFVLSWAHHRNHTIFKAPASMREWYDYKGQDIVVWDDMCEDRKDLGGQRITQLFDNQITSLDVKCTQGIHVKCPKIILTVNCGLVYDETPEKFIARSTLVNIRSSLLINPLTRVKYHWDRVDVDDIIRVDGVPFMKKILACKKLQRWYRKFT